MRPYNRRVCNVVKMFVFAKYQQTYRKFDQCKTLPVLTVPIDPPDLMTRARACV